MLGGDGLHGLGVQVGLEQGSADVARSHSIDAQLLRAVLGGGVAGHADHAVLGRGIGGTVRCGDHAVHGGHVHDARLLGTGLQHGGDLVAHAVQDAVEVDADDLVPGVQLGLSHRCRRAADARVVHGVVQLAVGVHGEPDEVLIVLTAGHVRHESDRGAAGVRDLLDDLLRVLLVDVRHHDLRALDGQLVGDRGADAGTGSRHEGDAVCERHVGHGRSLLSCPARAAVRGWWRGPEPAPVPPTLAVHWGAGQRGLAGGGDLHRIVTCGAGRRAVGEGMGLSCPAPAVLCAAWTQTLCPLTHQHPGVLPVLE